MATGGGNIGTIRGTIEIDYDGAGVVKAIRETDKMKESGDRLDRTMNGILGTFGRFSRGAAIVAASSLVTQSSIQAVSGALAILGPLVGAGLATLPALLLGAAAAGTVAKLAFAGMGDALGAASEDTEKFNEAIKKLSPAARSFAQAYKSSLPALKSVQQAIQQAFFTGLASQVSTVTKRIVSLKAQAVGIAGAMRQLVVEVIKFTTSSSGISRIRQILSGVNAFLLQMRGSVGPLVESFINLAAKASQFGGAFGGTVAGGLDKLTNFVNNVDVAGLFEKALPILQALGTFLGNVGTIASQLFSVFNVDGANAAGILGELAGKLAEFLSSAQGQEALKAIGVAIQAISSGAGQVFLALLQALAPILVAISPAVTSLANTLTSLLVPAINALAGPLAAIAGWISDNTAVLGPLAAVVLTAAVAYKTYTAAVKALAIAKSILNSRMLVALGNWARLTAAVIVHTARTAALNAMIGVRMVAAWVASTAATVANTAATAANAAVRGGAFLASWIASTAAMVAQRVAMVAQLAIMGAIRAATIAWTAVQWLLNAALLANPIGLIIIGIVALVAAIILAWKNSETFRNIVMAVWNAIKATISAVVGWITGTAVPWLIAAWNAIRAGVAALVNFAIAYFKFWRTVITTIFNAIRTFVVAVWNAIANAIRANIAAIRNIIQSGMNAARAVFQAVWNAIRAVVSAAINAVRAIINTGINAALATVRRISQMVGTVRSAFNSARSAVSSGISQIVSLVRSLPSKVVSALGNLGSRLYSSGRSLIQGFINGISSMIGAVARKAREVVNAVTRFLPGSPAKEGPLSGKGYVLLRARRFMVDFAEGIRKTASVPVRATANAMQPVAASVPVRPSTSSSVPSAKPPTEFGPYAMTVDGKVLAEFVVDTVTGRPITVAKTQTEGTRVVSWAGSGR